MFKASACFLCIGMCASCLSFAQSGREYEGLHLRLFRLDITHGPKPAGIPKRIGGITKVDFVKKATQDTYELACELAINLSNMTLRSGQRMPINLPTGTFPIEFGRNGQGLRKMAENKNATALDIVCHLIFLEGTMLEGEKLLGKYKEVLIKPAQNGRGPMTQMVFTDMGFWARRKASFGQLSDRAGSSWLANAILSPESKTMAQATKHARQAIELGAPPIWEKYVYANLKAWPTEPGDSSAHVAERDALVAKMEQRLRAKGAYLPGRRKSQR